MDTIDIINFGITVFLGGASIALAIFSFISSYRNNVNSQEALQSLKDLSVDIKANLYSSIANQKDYTNKMLDTIISKSAFGDNAKKLNADILDERTTDEIVELKVSQIEKNLNSFLDKKLSHLNEGVSQEVREAISQMKVAFTDVKSLNNDEDINSNTLPFSLKEQLLKWKRFPAYLLVIGVIVKENIKNFEELSQKSVEYYIPEGWEDAILTIEKAGFLIVKKDEINIPENLIEPLKAWTKRNWQNILQLRANYKDKPEANEKGVTDIEREIGAKFYI